MLNRFIAFYFLIVSIGLSSYTFASQSPWYFNKYSIEQGLPQSTATCILKDKLGFMWVGTQGGLSRFDGYKFQTFKHSKEADSIGGNWVTDCAIDSQGLIWVTTAGGGLSKFNATTESFTRFNTGNSRIGDNRIWSLHIDNAGIIWLGSESSGLIQFDTSKNSFQHFSGDSGVVNHSVQMIRDIFEDEHHQLWLATHKGVVRFDVNTQKTTHIRSLISVATFSAFEKQFTSAVWSLSVTGEGKLWFGSKLGVGIVDVSSGLFSFIDKNSGKLGHDWATAILHDSAGNMWVGTYGGGISVFSSSGVFIQSRTKTLQNPNGLSSAHIMSFFQDNDDNFWVGTDGGGINFYAIGRQKFNHQKHDENDELSLSHSFVRALSQDSKGRLWVGTRNGLNRSSNLLHSDNDYERINFKRFFAQSTNERALPVDNVFALMHDASDTLWVATYGGGLASYNNKSNSFVRFTHDEANPNSMSSNYVYALENAGNNKVWAGTNQGINLLDTKTGITQRFLNDPEDENSLSQNTVFTLLQDSDERLWIGTRSGLNMLSKDRLTFTHYHHESLSPLSSNMVISLLQTDSNTLWIGTMQGLNRLNIKSGEIVQITEEDGLLDGNIFGLEQDAQGYLWISSNRGLSRLDLTTQALKHYQVEDGLQSYSFLLGASFNNEKGQLMFGGVNGFNVFNPSRLSKAARHSKVVFTDFLLANHSIPIASLNTLESKEAKENTGQLARAISLTNNLVFDHTQSIFSLEFSSLDYVKPRAQQFAYKLVGFDKAWLFTDATKRIATYSNIPSGEYKLQATTFNPETKELGEVSELAISILPAPWRTWWAYTLYTIAILLALLFVGRLLFRKREAEQQKQFAIKVADAKDTLLSNVSHEFRTPLTLILGPLDSLIASASSEQSRQSLTLVKRNGQRLLTMVNQVLDYRDLQTKNQVAPTIQDFKAVIVFMCDSFKPVAKERGIQFIFDDITSSDIYVEVVPDGIEKIIANLFSNAFKYSDSGSEVRVTLSAEEQKVYLTITDTGSGMSVDEIDRIFKRHHRAYDLDISISGYGLGLAIVKEIIEQHNGEISVISEKHKGSTFEISLPCIVEQSVSSKNGMAQNSELSSMNGLDLAVQSVVSPTKLGEAHQQKRPITKELKALIIEDNGELRTYISSVLSLNFKCYESENGKIGLAAAREHNPDVIICDVMMPQMDGYELVQNLRQDIRISHIPVMLLTAKSDRESKLKGLDILADDYLTKPFDEQELMIRAQRLISLRNIVKRATVEKMMDQPEQQEFDNLSLKDKEFINALHNSVEAQFVSPEFSAEQLAELMHMSPRTLQLKVKALTDMTPTDYLRLYRLNHAAHLLQNTTLAIGQISERSGFNSQSYFAKCFKTKYGCGAKAYRDREIA